MLGNPSGHLQLEIDKKDELWFPSWCSKWLLKWLQGCKSNFKKEFFEDTVFIEFLFLVGQAVSPFHVSHHRFLPMMFGYCFKLAPCLSHFGHEVMGSKPFITWVLLKHWKTLWIIKVNKGPLP